MSGKYNIIQSVVRAMHLLEHVGGPGNQAGISRISKDVGLHKSTCFGILYTLETLGYVIRDEDGRYALTARVCNLSEAYLRNVDLRRIAKPYLMELRNLAQETVHLVIREGKHAVYLDKIDGPHKMSIVSQIGAQAKLHCTGVGKAILAHMDEADRDEVLSGPMKAYTPYTVTSPNILRNQLQTIRGRGYSIDDQEIEEGLRCLAAPLFGPAGAVSGAISIAGPTARLTKERVDQLIPRIIDVARRLSTDIGHRRPGPDQAAGDG
jgi:DNA-binding IclR family transcriptional regulator